MITIYLPLQKTPFLSTLVLPIVAVDTYLLPQQYCAFSKHFWQIVVVNVEL